ncbi:MAG: FeoA family protein [bacterium]
MFLQKPPVLKSGVQAKTLAALQPGEDAIIAGYDDVVSNHMRLLEMGLIEGTLVRLVKRAPWGDPVQLFVRGYHLAISRKTAQTILVR